MACAESKESFAVADHSAMAFSEDTARFFGRDDSNFRALMDALATGDIKATMEVAAKGGLSESQASLLVRDSAVLASLMSSVGPEMCW